MQMLGVVGREREQFHFDQSLTPLKLDGAAAVLQSSTKAESERERKAVRVDVEPPQVKKREVEQKVSGDSGLQQLRFDTFAQESSGRWSAAPRSQTLHFPARWLRVATAHVNVAGPPENNKNDKTAPTLLFLGIQIPEFLQGVLLLYYLTVEDNGFCTWLLDESHLFFLMSKHTH